MILKIKEFLKKIPRHWLTSFSAWTGKVITSVVNIVSIRELLEYIGQDRYAVYIVAFSLSAWISIASTGISSALQNFISEHRAKNNNYDKYMIASLQIIIAIFLISLILIFLFSSFVQEILFRKFSYIEGLQNSPIVFVSSIFFLITTFAMVASYVLLANHKGPIALLLNPTGQVISMILIVLANHNNIFKNNILAAILIFSLPQALFFGIAFFVVFKKYLKQLFSVNKEIIKNLSIRSIKFQAITILYLMVGQIDMIIISQTLSSYYIIIYNSFMRFFMLPIFVFTTFLGSSWPRFSEMFIRKEFSTLKIILKRYYLYAFALVLFCTLGVYIFAPQVLKFLLPTIDVVYNKSLIIIFGAWTLITCWTEIAKVFLSSINAVRVMFMVLPFQIIISVGAQFVFSQKYQAEGIIFALFVSLLLTTFWALPLKMFKVLKKEGDSLL